MRLWSLHPRYLDRAGLAAAWREALLAQAVLAGRTRGYTRHPQLERFREHPEPLAAIGAFLAETAREAHARGYRYDVARIDVPPASPLTGVIAVTDRQLAFERSHLAAKLGARDPARLASLPETPEAHPLFRVEPGLVASWERAHTL